MSKLTIEEALARAEAAIKERPGNVPRVASALLAIQERTARECAELTCPDDSEYIVGASTLHEFNPSYGMALKTARGVIESAFSPDAPEEQEPDGPPFLVQDFHLKRLEDGRVELWPHGKNALLRLPASVRELCDAWGRTKAECQQPPEQTECERWDAKPNEPAPVQACEGCQWYDAGQCCVAPQVWCAGRPQGSWSYPPTDEDSSCPKWEAKP